jgi:hypothetical protein
LGAYTQQGRARSRRPHPPGTARPALVIRAAHAVESKAVVRIEDRSRRQPTPLPGLRCGARLVRRASTPRHPTPVVRSEGGGGAHPPVPFGLSSPPAAAAAGAGGLFLVTNAPLSPLAAGGRGRGFGGGGTGFHRSEFDPLGRSGNYLVGGFLEEEAHTRLSAAASHPGSA